MLRSGCVFFLLLLACTSSSDAKAAPKPATEHASSTLPVTTSSAEAHKSFETAMLYFEDYRFPEMLQNLRLAVKADPKFAQAFILIARQTSDPAEQAFTRKRAKELAPTVTNGERLLIRWLAGAQEDNYVPAIAAMNDLLSKYPEDHRLAFMAGDWLLVQQRYEQATMVLQRALTLLPDYAAAFNDLAYAYAATGNFDKAFAAMDRYVVLEPDQPNPHDSYGEILRMAGKFEAALEQYRASIRMDPTFGSEAGVADTYALMGKEEEAREEYARAMVFAGSQNEKAHFELQSAITWIRENNRKQAEKSLDEVAKHAHAAGLAGLEAEAHRALAMYEPDLKSAMKQLQAAQTALQQGREISALDRDQHQASILRVRVMRLAEAQDIDSAAKSVKQLETMAGNSRSEVIQTCYHGAAGALLMAEGKYQEAISHLEENSDDPPSMRLLWQAYQRTGASGQAQAVATRLAALNVPTVEQALIVPQFRAALVSQAGQP